MTGKIRSRTLMALVLIVVVSGCAFRGSERDPGTAMHTGSDDDAFAFAYWRPANQTGTVILTNSREGFRVVLSILDLVGTDQQYLSLLRAMTEK